MSHGFGKEFFSYGNADQVNQQQQNQNGGGNIDPDSYAATTYAPTTPQGLGGGHGGPAGRSYGGRVAPEALSRSQRGFGQGVGTVDGNGYDVPGQYQTSYQQGPSAYHSSYQQGPSAYGPSYQQGPSAYQSSYQQGPSAYQSSYQQGHSAYQPSYQQRSSPYQSSYQQGPSAYQSSYQQGPSAYQPAHQQGPSPYQPSYPQGPSAYPNAGLIDHSYAQPSPFPNVVAAPTIPEAATSNPIPRPSKKRTRTAAGLASADVGNDFEGAASEPGPSTRRPKRAKASSKKKDAGNQADTRERKTSKLNIKKAKGKAPKKGALAPIGEVRVWEDGRMEFRDINYPEWTLAAYHNDYRRELLDEAARDGDFVYEASRGTARNDETSYHPEQQAWGPSRADWQNIVDAEGTKVMFEVEKPKSRHPPQEPSIMVRDGRILLDMKNHPVKDWPELNKTLSTEIECWRWEGLMRTYPWLMVMDLMARMPHTREIRGEIRELQTPQAFTNRAYRFRIPNQIPTANPKNGSAAFKEEILKNLAEKGASSTEDLSLLDNDQVANIRKANKGKFMGNSRYIVEQVENLQPASPASNKRKARRDDESELEAPGAKKSRTQPPPTSGQVGNLSASSSSNKRKDRSDDESEMVAPEAKRPRTQVSTTSAQNEGLLNTPPSPEAHGDDETESGSEQEAPQASVPEGSNVEDPAPETIGNGTNEDAFPDGVGSYIEPTDFSGPWDQQEQEGHAADTANLSEDETLDRPVALFASVEDQELALEVNDTFTDAISVIADRMIGNPQETSHIGAYWYLDSVPRHMNEDGTIVRDVVEWASRHCMKADENGLGNMQSTSQTDFVDEIAGDFPQSGVAVDSAPSFDEPSDGGYTQSPVQTWPEFQAPTFPVSQVTETDAVDNVGSSSTQGGDLPEFDPFDVSNYGDYSGPLDPTSTDA